MVQKTDALVTKDYHLKPQDILQTVSPVEAKRIFESFLLARCGLQVSDAKTLELARTDVTTAGLYQHFISTRAMSANDLPVIIEQVIKRIDTPNYTPAHRKISRFIQARDYKTHDILANIDGVRLMQGAENSEKKALPISAELTKLKVQDKPKGRVDITRDMILNGTFNFIDLPKMMKNAAYRIEAEDTYGILENPGNLDDGAPLFDASNSATGSSLADVGAALAKFRGSKVLEQYSGLEPKYFVVPADVEFAAHKAIWEAGLKDKLEVISTPMVTTKSYLFADPSEWPVLVRLALTEQPLVETWSGKFNTDILVQVTLLNDYIIAPVSRVGIVKLEVQ